MPGSRTTTLVKKGHGAFFQSLTPVLFSLVPLNPGCRLPPAAGGREGGLEASTPSGCKGIFIVASSLLLTDSQGEPNKETAGGGPDGRCAP